jgi:hypothetical protein
MSMLTEACATCKPVYMFDLHTGPENRWRLLEPLIGEVDTSRWRRLRRLRAQPLVFRIAFVLGPTRMTRDVRIIHRQLQAQGRAVWLGETFPDGPRPPPLDDVARAVARVKALFPRSAATAAERRAAPADLAARHPGASEPMPSTPARPGSPYLRASRLGGRRPAHLGVAET